MKYAPAIPAGALVLAIALVALFTPAAQAADGYLGVMIQSVDETLAAALDLEPLPVHPAHPPHRRRRTGGARADPQG